MLDLRVDVDGALTLCPPAPPTPPHLADYLIVGSDSGRIVVLEYDADNNSFNKLHQETYGRSGARRILPGQYLAADPKGRAVMVGAMEKSKLVYILNRVRPPSLFRPLEPLPARLLTLVPRARRTPPPTSPSRRRSRRTSRAPSFTRSSASTSGLRTPCLPPSRSTTPRPTRTRPAQRSRRPRRCVSPRSLSLPSRASRRD